MKALFGVMLLGALIALPACQFAHPIFPDAIRTTATNDADDPIQTGQLAEGEEVSYAIWVPPAVVDQDQLLYLEVEVLNPFTTIEITAHNLVGQAYAQSDSPDYFIAPDNPAWARSAEVDTQLAVQSIVPTIACRGPCILQPAEVGMVYLKLRNTGIDNTIYNLYAFTEVYSDANEPTNDTLSGVVEFSGSVQGALETLNDADYYVTAGPVRSVRITGPTGRPITVAPRAELTDYDTGGSLGFIIAGTLNHEETFGQSVRVRIEVFSDNERAGPSESSFYEITTTE